MAATVKELKDIIVDLKMDNEVINFHKPHPSGILKRYVLDQVIEKLRKDDLL